MAVKADAYGHGAVQCAKTLSEAGADMFGLATAEEARELLQYGISTPLLLLGLVCPEELPELIDGGVALVAGDRDYLEKIWKIAATLNKPVRIHLKVDLGMGRLGCQPEEVLGLAKAIFCHPFTQLEGFCTHFPSADNHQPQPTLSQLSHFNDLVKSLEDAGLRPPLVHGANSAALVEFPESHGDMVRPGIITYGYLPDEGLISPMKLTPVMSLETRVSFVKDVKKDSTISYSGTYETLQDTKIATLPLGYADGYFRAFSNLAPVRIGDGIYKVSGRVCMDQFMVDLGPESSVTRGERAVVFGPEGPTAWDLAREIGTIPYEITCAVSKRVPRVYVE